MSQSIPAEETAAQAVCSLPIVGATSVEDAVFYTAVGVVAVAGWVSWPTAALIGTGHALHQRARNVLRGWVTGEAREALNRHYAPEPADRFLTAGMCLYRDGRDSVAWHGDRLGRGRSADTMVAIVSFGSPRPLLLRPAGGGGESLRFPLGHGDLVVMGGSCQRTFEHCIPKTARPVGPRVSVQFRPAGVA